MPLEAYDMHHVGHGHGRAAPLLMTKKYSKDDFLIPEHYKDKIECVLIPRGVIKDRIEKLAQDIFETYKGQTIHLVCILESSRGFLNELLAMLNRLSRYVGGEVVPFIEYYIHLRKDHHHPGHMQSISDDLGSLHGKPVLIVDGMIATGQTLARVCRQVLDMKPQSVRVASLFEKIADSKKTTFKADFVGFQVPNNFLVGYCLEHDDMFRDLEHVAILKSNP